jgi:hypothetical protein
MVPIMAIFEILVQKIAQSSGLSCHFLCVNLTANQNVRKEQIIPTMVFGMMLHLHRRRIKANLYRMVSNKMHLKEIDSILHDAIMGEGSNKTQGTFLHEAMVLTNMDGGKMKGFVMKG